MSLFVYQYRSLKVRELWCSRYRSFVTTHFHTIVSTLHDWYWPLAMKPRGLRTSFPTFLLLHRSLWVQSTCLDLWTEIIVWLMYFVFPKQVCTVLKTNLNFLTLFYNLLSVTS